MDKDVAKRLMRSAGLPIVPFLAVTTAQPVEYDEATSALGRPSCS
jgi:D-alanine-D-alanine ligase